jgi:hypothetical protein
MLDQKRTAIENELSANCINIDTNQSKDLFINNNKKDEKEHKSYGYQLLTKN